MATFGSYFQEAPPNTFAWNSFNKPLSTTVRQHLSNVYTNLALMLSVSTVGAYVHLTRMMPLLQGGTLSGLATIGFALAFAFTQPTPSNESKRKAFLYGFAFAKGLSLGPLLDMAMWINPSYIVTALVGAAAIFGAFSVSAHMSGRRDMLYIGGILGTAVSTMGGMSLVNLFLGSRTLFSAELYLGLIVFSLYVVYDTQLIIAKAELGSRDYLAHSMELYVDFVAIFVRILIILQKREADKERQRERENRRKGRR